MAHLLAAVSGLGATLANGWSAVSILAALGGLGGLALIALAVVLGAYLPAALRHGLLGAGLCVLVGAGLFQAGQARGAHAQMALDARRALAAERARTAAARAVTERLAAQATRDLAAAQADTAKLKGIIDAMRSADRGAACLPRALARRLRAL